MKTVRTSLIRSVNFLAIFAAFIASATISTGCSSPKETETQNVKNEVESADLRPPEGTEKSLSPFANHIIELAAKKEYKNNTHYPLKKGYDWAYSKMFESSGSPSLSKERAVVYVIFQVLQAQKEITKTEWDKLFNMTFKVHDGNLVDGENDSTLIGQAYYSYDELQAAANGALKDLSKYDIDALSEMFKTESIFLSTNSAGGDQPVGSVIQNSISTQSPEYKAAMDRLKIKLESSLEMEQFFSDSFEKKRHLPENDWARMSAGNSLKGQKKEVAETRQRIANLEANPSLATAELKKLQESDLAAQKHSEFWDNHLKNMMRHYQNGAAATERELQNASEADRKRLQQQLEYLQKQEDAVRKQAAEYVKRYNEAGGKDL